MELSSLGKSLIEQFEGCSLVAYRDQAGFMTIGYGHKSSSIKPGQTWTQFEADSALTQDVQWAVAAVNRMVKVPLNQNQFDALVDFVFNLGSATLASSTLLRLLNDRQYEAAAEQFPKFNHAGGKVIDGLTRRRLAEQKLFLTPQEPS